MSKRKITPQTAIYQLENIGADPQLEPQLDGPLLASEPYEIQGTIDDHIIVSVPPEMSQRSIQELLSGLTKKLDKPGILVTHNVQFLRARKLTFKEAIQISKRTELKIAKPSKDTDKDKEVGES